MQRKEFIRLGTLASLGLSLHPLSILGKPFLPVYQSANAIFYTNKDAEYDVLRQGFNSRINKFPAAIALCKNTLGVQEAIRYAKKYNLTITVKSGGHSMEGFSCGTGTMQINLSLMNQINWVNDYEIKVGPACLLKDLYKELIPKNRILPGGSCATVAIGGLSLGGGYGLMSRLFGLTCDSLKAVTMVSGNGEIISSDTDPELLWACKGGGNGHYGVITEMHFKVHNRPKIMSSYRFRSFKVSTERAKSILGAWFEQSKSLPKSCFSSCLFNGDTAYILLTNVSGSSPAVQTFISNMQKTCDKFTSNTDQPLEAALKNYYGLQHPVPFKNASAGLYRSYAEIEPALEGILNIVFRTKGMILQFNTLGGAIQDPEFERQSSFPHREYTYFTELQAYWEAPNTGELLMKRFEEVQQLVSKQGIVPQYANYPDINFSNYETRYYGKNLERLRAVKMKYDPGNWLRYEQSIKPEGK